MLQESLTAFKAISFLDVIAFLIPFVVAVAIDLLTHKKGHKITIGNAFLWSLIWVVCSAVFSVYIWWSYNHHPRVERVGDTLSSLTGVKAVSLYATGYVLEKALALDNLLLSTSFSNLSG